MTWSKHRNPDLFWPLKFLPFEQGINKARILVFGYNSNFRPGSAKTKASVLDFAKDLLYDMKYSTDESLPEVEDLRMGEVGHNPLSSFATPANGRSATHHIHSSFDGWSYCERGIYARST